MCNNLETMKNKHEMSGKGKTVVFPCDSSSNNYTANHNPELLIYCTSQINPSLIRLHMKIAVSYYNTIENDLGIKHK